MRGKDELISPIEADQKPWPTGRTGAPRTDAEIAAAVASDPDAAPLDLDWTQTRVVFPEGKEVVTLRLDRDVLAWFRGQGKGYQTRMNAVLRAFYEAKRGREAKG